MHRIERSVGALYSHDVRLTKLDSGLAVPRLFDQSLRAGEGF
jgi:hypothetical protein